jgi:transcriptional regulator with XRE-family HTH domain
MEIGKIIKKLRCGRGMTQKELAELVGVTVQAVSKWEIGAGLPDISQVLPLSRALDVSTDTLFGASKDEEQERIDEIMAKTNELWNPDNYSGREEVVALWRELVREMPNSDRAKLSLAQFLAASSEEESVKREAAAILERLRERLPDSPTMYGAISTLAQIYAKFGEFDTAEALIETLPEVQRESNYMLTLHYRLERLGLNAYSFGNYTIPPEVVSKEEAEKIIEPFETAVRRLVTDIGPAWFQLTENKRLLGLLDKEELTSMLKVGAPLLELEFFRQRHYVSDISGMLHNRYVRIVQAYMLYGDAENALEQLEISAGYAEKVNKDMTITHSLIEAEAGITSTDTRERNLRDEFALKLEAAPWAKPLRNEPRFKAVMARIRG